MGALDLVVLFQLKGVQIDGENVMSCHQRGRELNSF